MGRRDIHGHTTSDWKSHEYNCWSMMKQRCLNPRATAYRYYGGKGISVCEEWRNSFAAFLADIGTAPSSAHSIDRINSSGNYEPSNVRWATRLEQHANQRHVGAPKKLSRTDAVAIRALRSDGVIVRIIAERYGVNPCTVNDIVQHRTWKEA